MKLLTGEYDEGEYVRERVNELINQLRRIIEDEKKYLVGRAEGNLNIIACSFLFSAIVNLWLIMASKAPTSEAKLLCYMDLMTFLERNSRDCKDHFDKSISTMPSGFLERVTDMVKARTAEVRADQEKKELDDEKKELDDDFDD